MPAVYEEGGMQIGRPLPLALRSAYRYFTALLLFWPTDDMLRTVRLLHLNSRHFQRPQFWPQILLGTQIHFFSLSSQALLWTEVRSINPCCMDYQPNLPPEKIRGSVRAMPKTILRTSSLTFPLLKDEVNRTDSVRLTFVVSRTDIWLIQINHVSVRLTAKVSCTDCTTIKLE